jgi:DIE2/ALG10 family
VQLKLTGRYGLSAVAAAAAVMCRQTNVVWCAFLAAVRSDLRLPI